MIDSCRFVDNTLCGKWFRYHGNGTLMSYCNLKPSEYGPAKRVGITILCYSDRTVQYLSYTSKNGWNEVMLFNQKGDKYFHSYKSPDIEDISYTEYRLNTQIKITIRKAQMSFRRRYLNKLCKIFTDSTILVIKPLIDMIIDYVFKINNVFVIDHSIMHVGRIT